MPPKLGAFVQAYCTQDSQNGKMKGSAVLGIITFVNPDGTAEVVSPIFPPNQVFLCYEFHDAEKEIFSKSIREFVTTWRKRLGVL